MAESGSERRQVRGFPGKTATSIRRLVKDIPDYVLESDVRGGTIIFPRGELEDFLGISMKVGWRRIFSQLGRER